MGQRDHNFSQTVNIFNYIHNVLRLNTVKIVKTIMPQIRFQIDWFEWTGWSD